MIILSLKWILYLGTDEEFLIVYTSVTWEESPAVNQRRLDGDRGLYPVRTGSRGVGRIETQDMSKYKGWSGDICNRKSRGFEQVGEVKCPNLPLWSLDRVARDPVHDLVLCRLPKTEGQGIRETTWYRWRVTF